MLFEVALDIKAFMIILVYACLGFSFLYHHIGKGTKYSDDFYKGFFIALGSYDTEEISEEWP